MLTIFKQMLALLMDGDIKFIIRYNQDIHIWTCESTKEDKYNRSCWKLMSNKTSESCFLIWRDKNYKTQTRNITNKNPNDIIIIISEIEKLYT